MAKIHSLPIVLINQIAAGEVIVRPASVVKELLENAIDAGASQVRIEVDRACRNITITDNGEGMTPEDALLAIERHATSKISTLEDLNAITTRGFRGEAMASIAAVSRLELITRPASAVAGFRIQIEGGRITARGPIGCPAGTCVRVRDLFFNTPARRKFLKRDASEFAAIMQLLTRQMLSRGDVGFTIIRGEKKHIELPTDQPLASRMTHLLGNLAETDLVKINQDRHGVRVYGYVSRPQASRKDRREQYFFVNDRPVTHRSMGYALGQAYHGLLMNGRFPLGCLFIQVAPEEVDINVHPTKEEVRFHDEGKITGVLNHAVVDALRRADLIPEARLTPAAPDGAILSNADRFAQRARQLGFSAPAAPTDRRPDGRAPLPELPPLPEPSRPDFPYRPLAPADTSAPAPAPAPPDGERRPALPEAPDPDPGDTFAVPETPRLLGQVGDSYILARTGDDLIILDQHAAHERIHYNRVMKLFASQRVETQTLLLPITFEVSASEVGRLEEALPLLRRMGIEVEPFGGRAFVAHSLPAALPDLDVAGLARDILGDGEEGGGLRSASPQERLAARIACRSAVKANQTLSDGEMRDLLRDLRATDDPHTCPHGRPTMIRLTRDELDRQFKRK